MELQQQPEPEKDLLKDEFNEMPVRTQYMPVWFGAINALFIVISAIALTRAISYLMSYSKLSYEIRVSLISFVSERLAIDVVYIITMVPAVMFLLRKKQAVYWGMITGVLRIVAAVGEMVFRPDTKYAEVFALFLQFAWLFCIGAWTFHAFQIRRKWVLAQPGSLFK